jgi:hypothetical protein
MGDALEGDFRKAMRTLASAVSIVSTAYDNRRFGMTATAVCSLSMQPPTLLVCINQSTSLHHPLLSAGRFCINILHADQDELARTFGRKGIMKTGSHAETGRWMTAACPLLPTCVLCRRGKLRPSNAFHRGRRRLPGGGARQRPSAALPRWTIYRWPRRRRRLGHSHRSLKLVRRKVEEMDGARRKGGAPMLWPRSVFRSTFACAGG